MRVDKIHEKFGDLGVLSFLILISIAYITTNEFSRSIVEPVRILSMLLAAVSVCFLIIKNKLSRSIFIALTLYFLLLAWGLLLSSFNDAIEIGINRFFINAAVTTAGLLLITLIKDDLLSPKVARYYVAYVFSGLIVTILIGGLDLSFPPRFIFEYVSENRDQAILYSQGVSKFFGYGAIAAIFLFENSKNRFERYCALGFSFAFLLFSLLGGARGDSLFAIVIVLGFLAFRHFLRTGLLISLLTLALILIVNDWSWADDWIIFQRLASLESGYGQRDLLLTQSLEILSNEMRCLLFGCGFGFFQSYYGYDFGLYPHNFVAELLITFGAPLVIVVGIAVVWGFKIHLRSRSIDLFVLFFIYSFLLGLKSGSLLSDWFLMMSFMYFLWLFIRPQNINRDIIFVNQSRNFESS